MTEAGAAEFCQAVRTRLVGALTLACGDRGIAEELAQDTLVRVWERWPLESPEGWTFRTGFNLASSWRRRRGAERRANRRSLAPGRQPDVANAAEIDAVRGTVSRLPERQRAVIVARYYLGYDVAGTAILLGCAPGTVKAAAHQAMANLRLAGLGAMSLVIGAVALDRHTAHDVGVTADVAPPVLDRRWTALYSNWLEEAPAGAHLELRDDGTLLGFDGCNRFDGRWTAHGNQLIVHDLTTSRPPRPNARVTRTCACSRSSATIRP